MAAFFVIQLEFVFVVVALWVFFKKVDDVRKPVADLEEYNTAASKQFQECLDKIVNMLNAHSEAIEGMKKGMIDGKDYLGYLLKTKYYG